jgi:hypothetical protein
VTENRKFILESIFLFAGFLLLYLLTLSHNLAASSDSIFYLSFIDQGHWLFHPHHLLNEPLCILWLRFWRLIGISSDSAYIVASINSLFGAAGLGTIYFINRSRFKLKIVSSIIPTCLIGFSFGYWFYSDCIKTNIIPVFLCICILTVLLKLQLSKRDIILLAVLNGLAIIFHEVFILSAFSTLLILYLNKKETSIQTHLYSWNLFGDYFNRCHICLWYCNSFP